MTVMAVDSTRMTDADNAPGIVETAHTFGDGLVGVLTRPAGTPAGTALILLNAGLLPRVGPFRTYVQLARSLAAEGFVVFRFDQSGLGDSPVSSQAGEGRKRRETVAAMDVVARETGVRQCVLGGLCSAADDAFNIAPQESRVMGLLLLDGVAYITPLYRLRYYLPRLLHPGKVLRGVRRLLRRSASIGQATIDPNSFRDFPSQPEAVDRLKALDARGASVLMLYTGGIERYYNHKRQARECFGTVMRSPRMSTEYWADCDHTFYARQHRERLSATVVEWMKARYAG
ncbi:pimeloyl-ACP methyl ester carboxylesterase [Pseudoxanthomonas japonensis]|uniref:alpha/beta hydrolase n=1 Tax=Pseudoxanthomonas japonensis TaxID=69284 RepID=UPI001A5386DA|nr:alpha/beta hydrolase [Pseudoxanthomonas japonensis]MBL8258074.1 alpha/beta hydrolase [Pseudoxanthomonas mexicana]MDR7067469.1 pimeloyl-ACP methyl ester carboxylesterase [Pseudoxanthomonas japonensis]